MIAVSQNQALKRWDALPDDLREAIISDINSDFLQKTCEAEHLSGEKTDSVARIAGYVLAGFIHPEDLAQEIADATQINRQVADSIANAVSTRIFEPLKEELAKIYEPPSKFPEAPAAIRSEPPPTPFDIGKPVSGVKKPEIVPPVPPPAPFKISTGGFGAGTPSPKPVDTKTTLPLSEFERIGIGTAPSVKPSVPSGKFEPLQTPKPSADTEPAPVIFHAETTMKPIKSSSNLNVAMPKTLEAKQKESVTAKPAVLEFGAPTSSPQKPQEVQQKSPRVVHYTEFRTPLQSSEPTQRKPVDKTVTPIQKTAPSTAVPQPSGREVQEITAMSTPPPAVIPPKVKAPTAPSVNLPAPLGASRNEPLPLSQIFEKNLRGNPLPPTPPTRTVPPASKNFNEGIGKVEPARQTKVEPPKINGVTARPSIGLSETPAPINRPSPPSIPIKSPEPPQAPPKQTGF